MCDSCVKPYKGKYLQQCPLCGDPMHDPHECTAGKSEIGTYYTTDGRPHTINCRCPEAS